MEKSGPSHLAKALGSSARVAGAGFVHGFRLGRWQVRPTFCELSDGVRTEHLEPKVMGVLLCLAQHAPQVVTRELFMTEVWGGRTVTDDALSRSVSLLRACLGDDSSIPRFIRTIPRVGYALIAPVEPNEPTVRSPPGCIPRPDAISGAPAGLIQLAVLRFVNLSRDPDQDYLVDGVADELAVKLSRVVGIRVVARTSALRFRGGEDDGREVGRQLGATHLLQGGVRSDGPRLHIEVQLVDSRTAHTLFAESYDGKVEEILDMQSDVAAAISRSLARSLPAPAPTDRRPPTWSLEAYQAYLRGQQQLKRRGATAIRASIDLFQEAVALDPHLAAAHAALAYAYALLPSYAPVDETVMYRHADLALTRASHDAGLFADICGVRAVLETLRNHWIPAEEAFQNALAANPAAAEMRQWYSQLLGAVGRLPEALQEARQALAGDPLSPILNFRLAFCCLLSDRDAEAERQFAAARELGLEASVTPEAFIMLLIRRRRFDEVAHALVEVQQARRQSDAWVPAAVAAIRCGRSGPEVASEIERAFADGQMSSLLQIGMLALSGHHEHALQALLGQRQVRPGTLEFLFAREARAARQHLNFARLTRQLGLDAYWERHGSPPPCH